MKVMSVGLISLIIFNIVLATNTSDSGPTTYSSLLLEEKTKKTHKTTEQSVNVKGKRPNEENYGDMIRDIYMPLEDSYQYSRNNSHEQDDAPLPVYKGPKKREFTEKRQLRTINENNEISQKPKDLLRTDPKKDTKTTEKTKLNTIIKTKLNTIIKTIIKPKPLVRYSTSNDVYNKHKHLLCTNPNEIKQAEELMDEAVERLEYHATNKDGYEYDSKIYLKDIIFCKKKHEGQKVYYQVINKFWDPDFTNVFDNKNTKRKIVRVYNPNLVMIQQRYKDSHVGREKYFYALAKKVRISEDTTIIAMTSANINDGHPSKEEFKNALIENGNLFKTQINSEDDIRNEQLEKKFLNIGGFLIKKILEHVSITHIKSMYGNASINQKQKPINQKQKPINQKQKPINQKQKPINQKQKPITVNDL
ncbi:fam-a protein [Plasmodium vinckei brucechwatti]|uniref:Fam-a protein n=1 Tax=Plasmodium vinckei brucechwatti TaxID=119398 RepID=A0A6V7SF48_PLAVN|nr:fam-a protein [Plasmodium vinckei brucechwatti]